MKLALSLLTIFITTLAVVANDDLLLNVGFEGTLKADKANGSSEPTIKRMKQPQFTKGICGNAVRLNKSAAISYPTENNINLAQGTIAFWMRPADWNPALRTNTYHWIFSLNKSGPKVDRFQFFKMPRGTIAFFFGKHARMKKFYYSIKKWKINQWHLITISWTEKYISFYIDGKKRKTYSLSTEDLPLELGKKILLQGGLETTDFDNFQIYKRSLNDAEIKSLYQKYQSKIKVVSINKSISNNKSLKPFPEKSVKLTITPAFEFKFDRMKVGVKQNVDSKYTYDKIPSFLLNGLLYQGLHRVKKGTSIQIKLLEPADVYFFFHPAADGGYTNIFLNLKGWKVCDTAPQYDIHNGTHGLKMTMYHLRADAGVYNIPPTSSDNACFSMVFCSRK